MKGKAFSTEGRLPFVFNRNRLGFPAAREGACARWRVGVVAGGASVGDPLRSHACAEFSKRISSTIRLCGRHHSLPFPIDPFAGARQGFACSVAEPAVFARGISENFTVTT
jgi:hypothetical protein